MDALLEPARRELLDGMEACGRALAVARDMEALFDEALFDAYRAVAEVIASALLQYLNGVRLPLDTAPGRRKMDGRPGRP